MKYHEQEIEEAFENGTLFLKCLTQVEDDEGIYALAGSEYEVIGEDGDENCWIIESEETDTVDELEVSKDDSDFELFIKE